jgi:hypothetical protein
LAAADGKYLRDGNIVFGVVVKGEARAYPKRILAWHEMAIDRVGGVDMTIVYCTLCGTVIPYESRVGLLRAVRTASTIIPRCHRRSTRSRWAHRT